MVSSFSLLLSAFYAIVLCFQRNGLKGGKGRLDTWLLMAEVVRLFFVKHLNAINNMIVKMNENQPNGKIQGILKLIEGLSPFERVDLFNQIYDIYMREIDEIDDEDDDILSSGDQDDFVSENEENYAFPKTLPCDVVKKFTLRVTLKGLKPAIYRKFEVPSNITLRNLGELILDVMGWDGYHMHQFRVGDKYYAPKWQSDESYHTPFFDKGNNFFSEDYVLSDVLSEKGKAIEFEYDFGDSWRHEVKLSSVGEFKENDDYAVRFVDGKRACPIEDCGGVWGYEAICAHYKGDDSFDDGFDDDFFDYYIDEYFDPEYLDVKSIREICEAYSEEIVRGNR